jgi:hypothetical protein
MGGGHIANWKFNRRDDSRQRSQKAARRKSDRINPPLGTASLSIPSHRDPMACRLVTVPHNCSSQSKAGTAARSTFVELLQQGGEVSSGIGPAVFDCLGHLGREPARIESYSCPDRDLSRAAATERAAWPPS